MRHNPPRGFVVLAGVSLAALALGACSGSGSGSSSSSSSAAGSSSAAKPSELTVWGSQSTPDSVKAVLADYEKTSGIKITLVTIPDAFESNTLTKFQAGQRPDIIFFQPGPGALSQLNPAKNLQDLGSLPFVSKTKFGLADSGAIDGVHYTATYDFPSVFGLFYNKKIFADNGITPPKTTAELNAAAAKLKAAGVTPFQVTGGDSWTTQIGYLGDLSDVVAAGEVAKINAGTGTVTTAPFLHAAGVARSWVTNGWVNSDYTTALYSDVPKVLASGKVAMYAMASWMNGSYTDPSNIGFTAYPSDSGAVQWQSSNNASVQLPKTGNSAREAASRDFVNWLTVGDGYKELLSKTGNPSIIDGVPDPTNISALNAAAAAAFGGKSVPSFDQQLKYGPSDRPALLSQVLAGTLTPAKFNEQYQAGIDKLRKLQS